MDEWLKNIEYESNPRPGDIAKIGDGINEDTMRELGSVDRDLLTFFIRDENGEIIGGVHGNTGGGWLYISSIWVSGSFRGKGLGSALMRCAEEEASKRRCDNAYLDTFSYQAPEFYVKLGYIVFAELESFPGLHRRIFFRKKLNPAAST